MDSRNINGKYLGNSSKSTYLESKAQKNDHTYMKEKKNIYCE